MRSSRCACERADPRQFKDPPPPSALFQVYSEMVCPAPWGWARPWDSFSEGSVSPFGAEVFNRQDKSPLQNFLAFCTTIGNIQTGSLKDYDEHSLEIQDEKEINLWF